MTDRLPALPAEILVEDVPIPADLLEAIIEPDARPVVVVAASRGVTWQPRSDGEAEWALRKYLEARDDVEVIEATADDYVSKIRNWAQQRTARARRAMEFFAGHLGRYAVEQRAASGGRRKTLRLPSGEVPTRGNPLRLDVTDEAKLEAWLLGHPEWRGSVFTVETVRVFKFSRAEVQRMIAGWPRNDAGESVDPTTGEVVPGARIIPKDTEITPQTISGEL